MEPDDRILAGLVRITSWWLAYLTKPESPSQLQISSAACSKNSQKQESRVGDVVVGIHPERKRHGVLQFDADETLAKQQLFIQGDSGRPCHAVRASVRYMNTSRGHASWLERLAKSRSLHNHFTAERQQPQAYRGVLGSSRKHLGKPAVLDRLAIKNSLRCFETTAATLPVHLPFLVVCGISRYYDTPQDHEDSDADPDVDPDIDPDAAAVSATAYTVCLACSLDPQKLVVEDKLASFFHHRRFDLDRPGFRLLRLERETGPVIKCDIFQAYMDDADTLIPYEALSYTWGRNDLTHRVMVNGQVLAVTANLYDALQHLRQWEQDRILWIDAICIDQGNLQERGHQVAHMSRIYAQAETVVIWLGAGTFETKVLMSSLRQFEKVPPGSAFQNWSHYDPRWLETWYKSQSSSDRDRVELLETQRCGLRQLAEKPWFKRVWILREVAKAKTAIIGCGTGWTGTKSFALAPTLLGVEVEEPLRAVLDIMPGPLRRSSWWSQEQQLLTLLWRFGGSEATDARDRVYALLDLASDVRARDAIQASYTVSEDVVARNTYTYLVKENSGLAQSSSPATINHLLHTVAIFFSGRLHSRELQAVIEYGLSRKQIQRFLKERGRLACVDADTMMAAVKQGTPILEAVLDAQTDNFQLTRELLDLAQLEGENMVKLLLLGKPMNNIAITDDVFERIVRMGDGALQTLLDRRGHNVEMTDSFIELARLAGVDLVRLALTRRAKFNQARGSIRYTIIRHALSRGMTLKYLLDAHWMNFSLKEWIIGFFDFVSHEREHIPRHEREARERIAAIQAAKEDLVVFLKPPIDKAEMVDLALQRAARTDIHSSFVTEAREFVESTLRAETTSHMNSDRSRKTTVIDEATIDRLFCQWADASPLFEKKEEILKYFLDNSRRVDGETTKGIVSFAMEDHDRSLPMILRREFGTEATITKILFQESAQRFQNPEEALQLLEERFKSFIKLRFPDPGSYLLSSLFCW
ncbi:hypothetical protein CP532_5134 [Ophiocordyceps camponoti-leonardi (nom. inval.)]|nr:hypothetical protein CP532_5134 [Ophiocordyceps camponoti-leonardi (nom. inval.)]